ncbi:MAG: precorrin-4 C(11)-methyltransferase [Pseudanabaenaceae cyanobacterium bins.68]|nr:precorrin-4 C(11)-methyltransferase [Pseudanabaenaceae cyanobacterium bins.68]
MTERNPIYLVGAGPGDPELITVKGERLLRSADVVLYTDSLIPAAMLQICQPQAELIPTAALTLEQILGIMEQRVRSRQKVVRLHDGDLSLYSTVYEQILGLRQAQLEFELVPGVSAYQLAAAKLNLELTVPGLVQTIILSRVSGRSTMPKSEELSRLAAHGASLCLYLSAKQVQLVQQKLLQHYAPQMAIAICYHLGWPDEQIWLSPLASLAATTQDLGFLRTTLFVISPALGQMAGSPVLHRGILPNVQAYQPEFRSNLYHSQEP